MISSYQLSDINEINILGMELDSKFSKLNHINNLPDLENIIVYRDDNKVLGFLHYLNNIDEVEILNLIVKKEKRNQNIASLLIDFLLSNVKKRIILEVRENNLPAIKLYTKFNFNIINIRDNYYGNENGIVMERSN